MIRQEFPRLRPIALLPFRLARRIVTWGSFWWVTGIVAVLVTGGPALLALLG